MDALAELAPLRRISSDVVARHEVSGYGSGSHRIDWLFSRPSDVPILLEVKNRIKDLIRHLAETSAAADTGATEAPEPSTQPHLLFRDTLEKFRSRNPSDALQGAWIFTPIKQEETVLLDYFAGLDHERLHFAILGDWKDDAYILSAESVDADNIARTFSLRASRRFVFTAAES